MFEGEMKPYFTDLDFQNAPASASGALYTAQDAANDANAKVAPLLEENARLREALERIEDQPNQLGYLGAQSASKAHKLCWDIAHAALGEKE